jgi:glucan biosynthesis protein C
MPESSRLHGLDVLRGVAMLLGVLLHASIAYQAGIRFVAWIDDTMYHSYFFDWLYLTINSFRMQLFFALAGFFSHMVIQRKGMTYFARNRFQRIVLPLLLSYCIILPATLAPYLYYQYSQGEGDASEHLTHSMTQFFTFQKQWGLMHLWFLYYLVLFYIAAAGLRYVSQFFRGTVFSFKTVKYPSLILLALISVTGLLVQFYYSMVPTIWTGLKPPLVQLAYFGLFFLSGWMLYKYSSILNYLNQNFKTLLLIGLSLSVLHVVVFNKWFPSGTSDSTTAMLFKFTFAAQTITLSLGSIGLFNEWFGEPTKTGKYLSEAGYWVYLVHLPLVLFLQLILLNSVVPDVLRFPVVVLVTTAIALLSYHYFVRNRWIGIMLNGRK